MAWTVLLTHSFKTDDPVGIERYWQRRHLPDRIAVHRTSSALICPQLGAQSSNTVANVPISLKPTWA